MSNKDLEEEYKRAKAEAWAKNHQGLFVKRDAKTGQYVSSVLIRTDDETKMRTVAEVEFFADGADADNYLYDIYKKIN